ncbi:MAG: peptide chain release factor 1 [Candidatus Aenigmatarchaeota archaeon]|nr:MAG: peptide chain release factor 1 [Candidatus Aenigmarchaeota archaeon]
MNEEKVKLRKLIRELEKIRGRHTELISVYVPSEYNLVDMINQLEQEKSTAMNIKSKATRKNVLAALEKITQFLRNVKRLPPNGLVVFCGNVSEVEGRSDIRLWSIEPPEKMNTKIYWCDQTFVLEPLKEMVAEKEVYGLIVLDAREATVGLVRGKRIERIKRLESTVPSKTVKGGMCLHRSTKVMSEKGEIEINKVKVGDRVLCFNLQEKKVEKGEVEEVLKRRIEEGIRIVHEKGYLFASFEHKVFVEEEGEIKEKFAGELKKGDRILVNERNEVRVCKVKNVSKRRVNVGEFFYDLRVKPFPNYFANLVLVHNSQARYDRLREEAIHEFLTKVGEVASKSFLSIPELKGVLIGGPGPIKERFAEGDYLHYQIKKKVMGVVDTSYTGEYGLEELVRRGEEVLREASIIKEKQILGKFFSELEKDGNAVYGFENSLKALEMGAVDTLLISENFDYFEVKYRCKNNHSEVRIVRKGEMLAQVCKKCGEKLKVEEKRDLEDEIVEKAKKFGTKVEYISTETPEGKQFFKLGGIGGILRFKVE